MKRFTLYALLLCLFLTGFAYANITIEGETVHVETDRYTVQFNKGIIEYIHNKLTDETYTHSTPQGKNGWTGLLFNRYFWDRENVATQRATLVSATQLSPTEVELLYSQEGTEVLLNIAVDTMTDDLLIDMEGVTDTPGVVGMQWGMGYLDIQNLSIIAPVDGGRVLDTSTPTKFEHYPYPASGAGWEAQLAIVQGGRGGFYIRNGDNTFQFKWFIYDRADNGVALNFGTQNQAPFDSHRTGESRLWRFNTYVGDWRVPAWKYRDWLEHAFDGRHLSDMPEWVKDITLFMNRGIKVHSAVVLDKLAEFIDPTKTLVLVKDWSIGREWWREGLVHYPDYEPLLGLRDFVEAAKAHGFRLMLYADLISFSVDHPLYPEFVRHQYRDTWTGELIGWKWDEPTHPHRHPFINPASSAFRQILVQELKAVWENYDIDGFFLDTSYYAINDANGLIDGLNSAQGGALLHKELAEAMPGAIFAGERLHEGTFALESFAQRALLSKELKLHPISAFLFSPFTQAISSAPVNPDQDPVRHQRILDYSQVWGIMPTLNAWDAKQLLRPEYVGTQNLLAMAGEWQPQYGINADVNGDGVVNILDLTLVARNVGIMPLTHLQTDLNGDGQVNVLDLILVTNMFEGITTAR